MTDDGQRRFVYLGSFEGGLPNVFEIPEEPLRKIEAQLDRERAEAERVRLAALADIERVRLAALADIERVRNTKRARAAKRLRRALRMFVRI
jgi:hypothetical protein